MLAVVKMPHTSFTVSGDIPENIMTILETSYKKYLTVNDEKDEYVEATSMEWFKGKRLQTPYGFIAIYINLRKLNWLNDCIPVGSLSPIWRQGRSLLAVKQLIY